MASIVVAGDTSGSVTIAAPAVSGTTTLNLPATSGTFIYADGSGNLQANSGYGSVATGYLCRAWVNFNGTGTVAIRASGNVTSITDNGTGDYTINFTTAMPDTNYTTIGSGFISVGSYGVMFQVTGSGGVPTTYTTSAVRINTRNNESSTLTDSSYVFGSIFR